MVFGAIFSYTMEARTLGMGLPEEAVSGVRKGMPGFIMAILSDTGAAEGT